MTEKRLFVGRKTVEDRFTIINDYENEIGVKENRSGDVLVLKHSDLNAQQFVAQLVMFLNDQNQAIVDLYDGSGYWFDKATEQIKELENENEQLMKDLIDHSALIRMLEDYQGLSIEDMLWNLTGVETEEEFNELYEPYFDKAKNCWSKKGDDVE